uniref:Linker histone H1 and H5 family protein n=1 Tax=Pithovirus LCPAC102 TaxID=2506587 RepID=A0A481Z3J9_9VIRU|nr:MAG: linker histone H1 and H5 family protein [Pithovirus LCPAC102]
MQKYKDSVNNIKMNKKMFLKIAMVSESSDSDESPSVSPRIYSISDIYKIMIINTLRDHKTKGTTKGISRIIIKKYIRANYIMDNYTVSTQLFNTTFNKILKLLVKDGSIIQTKQSFKLPPASAVKKSLNDFSSILSTNTSTKIKEKTIKSIISIAYRCTGLTVPGNRCKHKKSGNKKCHCHNNQIGRILVKCDALKSDGKYCNRKKIISVYKGIDGCIMYDKYLCWSHHGKFVNADQDKSTLDKLVKKFTNVSYRTNIEGNWFHQTTHVKCMGCKKIEGNTHGFYCSDCTHKFSYDIINRCNGITKKCNQCRHEKKMKSIDGKYICNKHK